MTKTNPEKWQEDSDRGTQSTLSGDSNSNSQSSSDSTVIYEQREDRPWVPLGHDDRFSPRTQARRDTPASSQQYSSWSPAQRRLYTEQRVRDATISLGNETEVLREAERYWRLRYNEAEDRARYIRDNPERPPEPVRVLIIREQPAEPQESSQRSQEITSTGVDSVQRSSSSRNQSPQETNSKQGNVSRRRN